MSLKCVFTCRTKTQLLKLIYLQVEFLSNFLPALVIVKLGIARGYENMEHLSEPQQVASSLQVQTWAGNIG